MVWNKLLEAIEERDLQALIDNQVSERKTIEYKEALPSNADGDKKEFLADVSSFANASGGDLIYGIREQSGVPVELSGLELSDVDAEILRLESCIQTGIAPRLFRIVETHPVALPSKQRYAILIRIRKSWTAPHMVTFKNDSKFFSRDSRGKHQLDVSELRSAFLLSETAAERIRNFRAEHISNVIAGETPVLLDAVWAIVQGTPEERERVDFMFSLPCYRCTYLYCLEVATTQRYSRTGNQRFRRIPGRMGSQFSISFYFTRSIASCRAACVRADSTHSASFSQSLTLYAGKRYTYFRDNAHGLSWRGSAWSLGTWRAPNRNPTRST
jgi:hypothetical protein